jgi:hypothetical protein
MSDDWRKSSYSNSSANCVEVAARWRKSSHSGDDGDCVEISAAERTVSARDSKMNGDGPVLEFTSSAWREFLTSVTTGRRSYTSR